MLTGRRRTVDGGEGRWTARDREIRHAGVNRSAREGEKEVIHVREKYAEEVNVNRWWRLEAAAGDSTINGGDEM